jgi:hypothetical protein
MHVDASCGTVLHPLFWLVDLMSGAFML